MRSRETAPGARGGAGTGLDPSGSATGTGTGLDPSGSCVNNDRASPDAGRLSGCAESGYIAGFGISARNSPGCDIQSSVKWPDKDNKTSHMADFARSQTSGREQTKLS